MRIGIVASPWVPVPPPAYGGTEAVLDTLARGLVAAGHDVVLFASGNSTCPVPRAFALPEAVGFGPSGSVAELRHVIAAYEALGDCDVVHDHTLAGPIYSARFSHLPVVTTNHGPFDDELTPIYQVAAPRAAVVAISHHQASAARGVPIAAVIHHGVDLAAYTPGPGTGGYACFLGRMTAEKGVHLAARAARGAGIPLRIAAKMREPAEREYFAACVEPLLGGDVEYLGEIAFDEKRRLLRDAACLLNPVRWAEPFGLVMIEALACGTPVIATPCGAAPEIIDHAVTGFLAATEHAITRALGHVTDLDRSACRRAAEDRFSATRMVRKHLALYERLLESREPERVDSGRRVRTPSRSGLGATGASLPAAASAP